LLQTQRNHGQTGEGTGGRGGYLEGKGGKFVRGGGGTLREVWVPSAILLSEKYSQPVRME